MRELIIDSFAGGGGASEGIRMALGRDPDIAVNHDPFALAMHRVNHPGTRHMVQDVATVDAVGMCDGRPIGMLWMSPDCTDHSKAKGAAPRRDGDRTTRGIGWAIVGWVKKLPKWQRPRVVFLENVEEYVDWGPLLPDGKRCPVRKGETFKAFVEAWRALGYTNIEWRQRRAWWSGSGTIRRRLYMIMRRDGEPIVWPEREFGNPNDPADAARIAAGDLKPWVTVAECIDFRLPCPSIFDSREEIKAKLGINAKRPLAPKSLARVAKGTWRHVIVATRKGRAFVVKVNHTARNEDRSRPGDVPLSAMTGKRDDALVAPVLTYAQQGGGNRPATMPAHTFTASRKDQDALLAPYVVRVDQNSGNPMRNGVHSIQEPSRTIHTAGSLAVVAPYLVPRYGERHGQEPRSYTADRPGPTPVPTGNEGNLAAVSMAKLYGRSVGHDADEPSHTLQPRGKEALLAAYIAQHNDGPRPGAPGHSADEPVSTISTRGAQQQLVAAHMLTMRGSDRRDARADEPGRTSSAGGNHDALVSLPLMTSYYSSGGQTAPADQPNRTDTAKARFGLVDVLAGVPPFGPEHEARARAVAEFLREHGCWDGGEFVTIDIGDVTVVLVDICMRMLTPRERFTANGFPRDYVIDHGIDEHGRRIDFTLEQQGYMCGNAVCPTEARALVAANYRERAVERQAADGGPGPLFMEAAE